MCHEQNETELSPGTGSGPLRRSGSRAQDRDDDAHQWVFTLCDAPIHALRIVMKMLIDRYLHILL